MDDGQAVGVDRALGLLRYEVVHHPEEAGGEEEAYGVVAVPPLHHGVGGAGVQGVRLEGGYRYFHAVDDVQQGGHQNETAEEPVAHVDVLGLAFDHRAEEDDGVADPDDGDQDVDRPFQFGVFFRAGPAHGQADRGEYDHQLPAPEGEGGQLVGDQADLAGALHRVIGGGEQCAAPEREDHRIGVQRAQTPEAGPGQVEVEFRPGQLGGYENADPHPDDSPDHRHDGELADHLVVIGGTACCAHVMGFRPRFLDCAASMVKGYWAAIDLDQWPRTDGDD
ncbi:hypothetical protein D3C85_947820 [compost metagenome]